MRRDLPRRRGGPTLNILVDLLVDARLTRSWLVLLLLVMSVVAALVAFVGQTVLPWAIYPAL